MKKFLSALVFVIICGIFNFCSADTAYDYDSNYIFIDKQGSGGYSTYLYVPSVYVQEQNHPYYMIFGRFVTIGGRKTISEQWKDISIGYNWDIKAIFENGQIRMDTEGTFGRFYRRMADALFLVAYGQNFYGY